MSTQTRWLFEAPLAHEVAHYANPYTSQEYYSNPELEFESTARVPGRPRRPAQRQPFFKDSRPLNSAPLKPGTPIAINHKWPVIRRDLASTYNRLGGLMQALARMVGIDVPSVLAVWQIESGGRTHTVGRAVIRFENHLFYHHWGRHNEDEYNHHFRHGGHNGQPGKSWQQHQFRESVNEPFQNVHTSQAREYQVLNFAMQLAGENPALQSISIGGPQILVSNYRIIGYTSSRQMFDAFQASERAHVLGFFDFCQHNHLLPYLRTQQWVNFAKHYNGPGQAKHYATLLAGAYQQASLLPFS